MAKKEKAKSTVPVALTIAGSDSGGGAGIQADLKTFAACRVFGTSVLTVITAQNTRGVSDIRVLERKLVRAQFDAVAGDLAPQAAKTGALGDEKTIRTVAEMVQKSGLDKLVVDPVMISKHGHTLLDEEAFDAIRSALLPRAMLVTPNRFEAAALIGQRNIETVPAIKEAAKRIYDFGPRQVIIKGSHFDKIVRDIYYDGTGFVEFGADKIDSERVHGSGCTFSAAITARLASGDSLVDAIGFSRKFISAAIDKAFDLGGGIAPVHPMHRYW